MSIAFDNFLPAGLDRESRRPAWQEGDAALPALYISHGAPPLFEDAEWIDQLSAWADSLPVPRGILIVSAHWEAAPLSLSAARPGNVVYDFGGFDPRYYRMRYDTPDATDLAREVLATLPDGAGVHEHASRGLDHGAWVPLKVMYPGAAIPVLQLSLPTQDPQRLLQLGASLRSLRERGILIVGSGFMTHGLPFLTPEMFYGNAVPGWSREFDAWAAEAIAARDVDELAAFRSHAPGMPYSHPTVEHFTPLFVTLGAADGDIGTAIEGYAFGLSKRSLQVA
ncbi:MAG: class III extradiol ring-cleavage dioxygenase [Candidatus Nanopelagicales bacterium]